MRITIFTIGTEGDVRPLVALGVALARCGHAVTVATDQSCADLVTANGLDYFRLSGDFHTWMRQDKDLQGQGLATLAMIRKFRARLKLLAADWPQQGLAAAKDAELLIGNGMVFLLAAALGERLGVPVVETQVVPTLPSDNPPLMPLPHWMYRLPAWVNRRLGQLSRRMVWHVMSPAYQEVVRPTLGLAPYSGRGPLTSVEAAHLRLFGYSSVLAPPPSDWPATIAVTGPWVLDTTGGFEPSPALLAFLASGAKPIYVGFGSMFSADAEALTAMIRATARATGRRFVLATGWGGLDGAQIAAGDPIHVVRHVPHDWLFPRMAGAIHHGGAGTTIAAARAGIPSIVAPVFGDQPFWASRLHRLGVAPPALARNNLTVDKLAAAIRRIEAPDMRACAEALAKRLRQEDGSATAISRLQAEGLLDEPRLRQSLESD
ncbi:glycosyltransferase [Rhizobium sp. AAP43]|uniref:glycosyltransferase n=1 Tax=Rhizobium sp. AAP43 TaxID=1523420 RepID=UPI0006B8DA79|nr:glycosyltransferase [Rhizobium sp. AAP43]KPF41752.1 glucosyl transferase [Rhizobium sp. AAP43]